MEDNKYNFNHDEENLPQSLGLEKDYSITASLEILGYFMKHSSISRMIEDIIKTNPKLTLFLLATILAETREHIVQKKSFQAGFSLN